MTLRALRCLTLLAALTWWHPGAIVTAAEDALRDQSYTSPNWGFGVRWHGDEWTIDAETSRDGVDSLALRSDAGDVARFVAGAFYDGDATACLDDQMAKVAQTPGAQNVAVVQDELGADQEYRRPMRAWALTLISRDEGDLFVYLDCRTLAPNRAVLIRALYGPAATFQASYDSFAVLAATLPRGAWQPNGNGGLAAPDLAFDGPISPLPTDLFMPWDFPRNPWLLVARDGTEQGMMTLADGAADSRQLLVTIENSGATPLTIDPGRFSAVNDPSRPPVDPPIALTDAAWELPGSAGPRILAPGTQASIVLEFPDLAASSSTITYLVYRDDGLRDGLVRLDCLVECGYGGGGSRIPLLIGR